MSEPAPRVRRSRYAERGVKAQLRRLWARRAAVLSGLQRFPVALLALAVFVVVVNLDLAHVLHLGADNLRLAGVATVGAAAIATAAVLYGERRWASAPLRHAVSLLLAIIVGYAVTHWQRFGLSPVAFLAALVLAVPLAPYIRGGRAGFWGFLWNLVYAGGLAFVAVGIFCAGLSAIFISMQYLFGAEINSSLLYGHIWSIGFGFVGPMFALSLIPRSFPTEDDAPGTDIIVSGVKILSDFVAVPLLTAYALILHAYAVKVLLAAELPRNQIGWMVLSFGLCVLLLRIVVHPLAGQSRLDTRLFLRFWAVLLVVPLALLIDATWLRLSSHGVTPERYALALFALVLGLIILAQVPRRLRADIRVIPALGATFLFLASFGPWGMLSASATSQSRRLVDYLTASGSAAKGQLTGKPSLTSDTASDVQSIVYLLDRIGQLDRIRPLFAGRPDDPFALVDENPDLRDDLVGNIQSALNTQDETAEATTTGTFWEEAAATSAVDITGFDVIVPRLEWNASAPVDTPVPGMPLHVELNTNGLVVVTPTERVLFPPAALRTAIDARIQQANVDPKPILPPLLVEATVEGNRIGVLFESVGGFSQGDDFRLQSGRASLLLRRADWKND